MLRACVGSHELVRGTSTRQDVFMRGLPSKSFTVEVVGEAETRNSKSVCYSNMLLFSYPMS